MHSLIIGATGATGRDLLNLILADNFFDRVDIFVRRSIDLDHPKLQVHIIDFDDPEEWKHLVKGDVLFSCLGTTLKAAGSKDAQWKIDYEYQCQFAKAARENGVPHLILISASNASSRSALFYSRMKGKLEDAVHELGYNNLDIFRPPLLVRKNTDRQGEVIGYRVIKFLNKIGLFRAQKPMPTEILAKVMVQVAKDGKDGIQIHKPNEIWEKGNKLT